MHLLWVTLFGALACFWVVHGLRVAFGAARLPWLRDFSPAEDADCPALSIIFAARDEEEKLRAALETLVALDYPRLEIVAVNDRSSDSTGRIVDEFAARDTRVKAVHVKELPEGWLGKPHALQRGYETATGEWLLFTDADVRFRPDALRRSVTLARERKLDHLTLLADLEMAGFWETVLLTFFGMAFHLGNVPHAVNNPRSGAYVGVGAFQLLKRSAYESSGTHRRLAMEVVDDMKLTKLLKQAGCRSEVGISGEAVVVRWQAGLCNLIRGTTKNFYAAFGYNLPFAVFGCLAMLAVNTLPVLGLIFGHGWLRFLALLAVLIPLGFHAGVDLVMRVSPLYALTYPIGAMFFSYMVARSVVVTLWQGGVTWRGTFYPLDQLKRGVV